jgi:hypothetical protein
LWGRVTEGGMGFCSTQITYFTRVLYIAKWHIDIKLRECKLLKKRFFCIHVYFRIWK